VRRHATRSFSATVPLANGDTHIVVVATDATGRTGQAEVDVTRDSIPPAIELSASERITKRRPGEAVVSASDNLFVSQVTLAVDGAIVATLPSASGQTIGFSAPASARAGDTLTLVATAVDRAGNTASATATVRVAADGALVGQVLSDVTGRPLAEAEVVMTPTPQGGTGTAASDDGGRYSFSAGDDTARVLVTKAGMTSVERSVAVASESGTVIVDARLTPLGPPVAIGADGGALTSACTSHIASGTPACTLSIAVPRWSRTRRA